ncbi:MAG TPA: tetratricopeptide repeat protein [Pyrinomonadaceae bacterium]
MRQTILIGVLICLVAIPSHSQANPQSQQGDPDAAKAVDLAVQVAQLYQQGKYTDALPLAKRCLEIREKLFTPKDEQLRTALKNLAEVDMALNKYGEARTLFDRLIKSYEDFNPTDLRLAQVLQRLAFIYFKKGEGDKTEHLYQRAINITETASTPEDQQVATAATYLAEYYQAVGDYKKAEPVYQRILSIREKQSSSARTEALQETLDRYACLLRKTGRESEARELDWRNSGLPPGTGTPVAGAGMPFSGGVINGKALSLPKPSYPDEARAAHVAGAVVVRLVIDERGKVIRACAIAGPPLLMRASEAAAYKALFSPTKISGQPVKVSGVVTYNFIAQ